MVVIIIQKYRKVETMGVAKNSMSSVVVMAFVLALSLVAVHGFSPQDYLVPHNTARAAVGMAPLSWSTELESYALGYAQSQVNQCLPLHHSNGPYGENLFWGGGKEWTAMEAVTAWTDEIVDYDYAANSCTEGKMCGHYTQVVWADTTQVGCAWVVCNDNGGGDYIICSYNPPGNYVGERPY